MIGQRCERPADDPAYSLDRALVPHVAFHAAFGIDQTLIEFVVDRSSLKQGRFTPGNHLPILPTEALIERQPDYVLLLTWNFAAEILAQQNEFRRRGGNFIIPVPKVTIC